MCSVIVRLVRLAIMSAFEAGVLLLRHGVVECPLVDMLTGAISVMTSVALDVRVEEFAHALLVAFEIDVFLVALSNSSPQLLEAPQILLVHSSIALVLAVVDPIGRRKCDGENTGEGCQAVIELLSAGLVCEVPLEGFLVELVAHLLEDVP